MKIELYCKSPHMPNEIVQVEDTMVEGLLATGNYVLPKDKNKEEIEMKNIKGVKL